MELATTLSTWQGRQAFDEQLAALLRTADFAQADADLTGWLRACPSRLAEICLGIGADSVTIAGWDQLHADFRDNRIITALQSRPAGQFG